MPSQMTLFVSGARNSSEGITPETTRLVIFSLPRCASSYAWQLACEVLGDGVIKTHDFLALPKDVPLICLYRDFRDCVVSHWRHDNPDRKTMTEEEIVRYCGFYHNAIFVLDQYARHYGARFLSYEGWVPNPGMLFDVIESLTGVRAEDQEGILARHTIEINRGLQPNEEAMLQENHVHEGKVGCWPRYVTLEGGVLLNELLAPHLRRWLYEYEGI